MKNTDASRSHLLTHEVDVELDVLRPSVMDRVGNEVHRGDVITVDKRRLGDLT